MACRHSSLIGYHCVIYCRAPAEYSRHWRVIAYGVNIGGFGFMVGSLANLIALRLAGDHTAWTTFHIHSIPALFLAVALGYALLFVGQVP